MYMKLADKHDAFENIVVMYLPRKVVWDFILIQKIARKKSIFNSVSKFDLRTSR